MGLRRALALSTGILLLGSGVAGAQDTGKVGITMGYPGSVGILWHATDRIALRPELSLGGGHSESSNSDSLSVTTGVSALFYGASIDNVRTYVSPRVTYGHSGLDTDGPTGNRLHSSTRAWSAAGSFGAQYAPNKRFSVFGELGFGYSLTESTPLVVTQSVSKIRATSWATRTGVGVVLYF
jgi:hypothetical protein